MSCKRSLATTSGKFPFFDEFVTHCQAEKKCKKRGEVLAPFTNRRDIRRVKDFLESNRGVKDCLIQTYAGASYWTGLEVSFTEDDQERVFTDGTKWKERRHGKIYRDWNKNYTDCAIALYEPHMEDHPFNIMRESKTCSWGHA